jgi:hypothetical protein
MSASAAKGWLPQSRPKVNTHIHLPPNFSAFESVAEAVESASREGLGVLGASNYYHFGVYSDFAARSRERNIFPLFGLEIVCLIEELSRRGVRVNDPGNPGKMYLCGKAITRFEEMTGEARDLIAIIRREDSRRMAEMVKRLARIFVSHGVETCLDEDVVIDRVMRRHGCPRSWVFLQERHVAQAFQESFFEHVKEDERAERLGKIFGSASHAAPDGAVAVQSEIRKHLMKAGKPGYVEERFVTLEQARRLTLALGGIPCYPVLADGAEPACEYERDVDELIEDLKALNVHCAEFIPVRNKPDVLARYVTAMRKSGMVVTAGTEHNTLDARAIEPACAGGRPVPEEIQDIFREGACVLAAHQFLAVHDRPGFVDGDGNLNAAWDTRQKRIDAFRVLGAAVIHRFHESNSR